MQQSIAMELLGVISHVSSSASSDAPLLLARGPVDEASWTRPTGPLQYGNNFNVKVGFRPGPREGRIRASNVGSISQWLSRCQRGKRRLLHEALNRPHAAVLVGMWQGLPNILMTVFPIACPWQMSLSPRSWTCTGGLVTRENWGLGHEVSSSTARRRPQMTTSRGLRSRPGCTRQDLEQEGVVHGKRRKRFTACFLAPHVTGTAI